MSTSATYTIRVSVEANDLEQLGKHFEPSLRKMLGHLKVDLLQDEVWLQSHTIEIQESASDTPSPSQVPASKYVSDTAFFDCAERWGTAQCGGTGK